MGVASTVRIDMSRPRREMWITTWADLPGLVLIDGDRYTHALLPGWEYGQRQVETGMIPDLEALAECGVRRMEATR